MHFYAKNFMPPSQINILADKLFLFVIFTDNGARNKHKVTVNKAQLSLHN